MSTASGAPRRALDPDLQLKRDMLAWEIRKSHKDFALRSKSQALEEKKFQREGTFSAQMGSSLVASVTAVVGALIGLGGVLYQQKAAQTSSAAATHLNSNAPSTSDFAAQVDQRNRILSRDPDVASEIFTRLQKQALSDSERNLWAQGLQMAQGSAGSAAANPQKTIYVHYEAPVNDQALSAVMAALTKAGYYVAGNQKVTQKRTGAGAARQLSGNKARTGLRCSRVP